jgi:hypothetical protein
LLAGNTTLPVYWRCIKAAETNMATSPTIYEIRVAGHLSPQWADWFEGLTITLEDNGDTVLTGQVIDQAALHGLLKRVRDLGLSLVSVRPVEPGPLKVGPDS